MTRFAWGVATDVGRVRQANEDAVLADDAVFAVADGMGGHRGGEIASQLAVDTLRDTFTVPSTDALVESVQDANDALFDRAGDDPDLQGMGTTLCAMALVDGDGRDLIGVVNVGDSRLYLLNDGELRQITEDHSLVATLERQGRLTRAEAAVHPQRNILTRALGIDSKVMVDSWEVLPVAGDRYLICSDGLFNELDDARIAATLRKLADPGEAARELVRLALEAGGRDNVTCVVVDVVDDDGRDPDVVYEAEPQPDPPPPADPPPTSTEPVPIGGPVRHRRSFTWRVALFVLIVLVIAGAAVGAIYYAGTNTFYVGFSGEQVTIYRGRPGGVLWIQPTIAEVTSITRVDVPSSRVSELEKGKDEASLDDARSYVSRLQEQIDQLRPSTTTTAPPTTSTTASAAIQAATDESTP